MTSLEIGYEQLIVAVSVRILRQAQWFKDKARMKIWQRQMRLFNRMSLFTEFYFFFVETKIVDNRYILSSECFCTRHNPISKSLVMKFSLKFCISDRLETYIVKCLPYIEEHVFKDAKIGFSDCGNSY